MNILIVRIRSKHKTMECIFINEVLLTNEMDAIH
mgnify:CR=1 FL=1